MYFTAYADTPNFAGFLLIGGGAFLLVTRALWGFGHWLRQEMQTGTLESLYLTPASMATILAGVALAFMLYSALFFVGAMVVGALLFQVVFQTSNLPMALLFLVIGLPPLSPSLAGQSNPITYSSSVSYCSIQKPSHTSSVPSSSFVIYCKL